MGKKVGTWIYYDKKGNQLSKIQHNQQVRQNNGFTLFVAFDQTAAGTDTEIFDGYIAKNSTIEAYIRKPSESEYSNMAYATSCGVREIKFEKVSDNEMTYGLVEGQGYLVYEMNFETFNEPTNEYGNINIDLKICKKVKIEGTYPEEHKNVVVSLGVINIYVQPTYNSDDAKVTDIEIINERFKDTVKKLGGVSHNQTLTTQDGGTIVIDGEVDTTKAKFSPLTNIENEDTTPATKGFVELKVDNLSKVVANKNSELNTKIDTKVSELNTKIDKNISDVNTNLKENYLTTPKVKELISGAGHIVDIDVAQESELEKNNKPSVGIKYKTLKNQTNYTEVVTIPLPSEVVVEKELHDEYKVKTMQNGSSNQTSEIGYAKFSYNASNTVKAKMPTNTIYFVEGETGDGEPANTETVVNAIRDGNDQNIADTYIKDINVSLNKDVITVSSQNGNGENKDTTNISLENYAHKNDVLTKLSELQEDNEHRLVSDEEKEKWNEKEIQTIDSLAIYAKYDWLPVYGENENGKRCVAKEDGHLPLIIYKWVWDYENTNLSHWEKIEEVKEDSLYICTNDGFLYKHIDIDPYFQKINELDTSIFVTHDGLKATKNLENYLEKDLTGANIDLKHNKGWLTVYLRNSTGFVIAQKGVRVSDLLTVISGSYNDEDKTLNLLFGDGIVAKIPVADLVDDLASQKYVEDELYNVKSDIDNIQFDLSLKANDSELSWLAKTGSFIDIENKPILNTDNFNSLTPNNNEELGTQINLHRISKTGSYDDLIGKPIFTGPESGPSGKYLQFVEEDQYEIGETITTSKKYFLMNGRETVSGFELDDPTDTIGTVSIDNDRPVWAKANDVTTLFSGSASSAGVDITLSSALNPDIDTLIMICWRLKDEEIYQSIIVPEEFLYYTTQSAPLALRSTTAENNKTLTLYKNNMNPTRLTINSNSSGQIEIKYIYRYSAMKIN